MGDIDRRAVSFFSWSPCLCHDRRSVERVVFEFADDRSFSLSVSGLSGKPDRIDANNPPCLCFDRCFGPSRTGIRMEGRMPRNGFAFPRHGRRRQCALFAVREVSRAHFLQYLRTRKPDSIRSSPIFFYRIMSFVSLHLPFRCPAPVFSFGCRPTKKSLHPNE